LSLLFHVVFSTACRGTHPRLALDALRHLRLPEAEAWSDLVLNYHAEIRAGSLAPDVQFKDFTNHVLHVGGGVAGGKPWGGAIAAARRWYATTVDALRRQAWSEAVYAAGVLSHYVSDPFLPLNTGQCERAAIVHRALEWCIFRSYGELQHILDWDQGGYPRVETSRAGDWLARLIEQGAELAAENRQPVIDHFDLAAAVKDPSAGMDQECKDRIARCLGAAAVSVARVLERAFAESVAEPPPVEITIQGFLSALLTPGRWIAAQMDELSERLAVEAIRDEVERTGKVVLNLTENQRTVRQAYADEVLKCPLAELDAQPAEPAGRLYGQGAAPRPNPNRLITSPVIDNRTSRSSLLLRRAARRAA
jgi:hypothetical protein